MGHLVSNGAGLRASDQAALIAECRTAWVERDSLQQEVQRLLASNRKQEELLYFTSRCYQCGRDLICACPVCDG